MKRFICWEPEDVSVLADGVVEFGKHRELVDRCHIPVQLLKAETRMGNVQEGIPPIEEEDLLERFLSASGQNVTFGVIGDSGFGKTHLMNWLYSRILERNSDSREKMKRQVLLVPRNRTSVPDIIELLLQGLDLGAEDSDLSKMQLGLQALRRHDPGDLNLEYLNSVAVALNRSRENGESSRERRRADKLYRFIREGEIEKFLLRDEGRASQIVARLQGRAGAMGEASGDLTWRVSDLELPESVAEKSDRKIRLDVANLLSGPTAGDLLAALNAASKTAFGGLLENAVRVNAMDAMAIIREKWYEQEGGDFELVLILEDLARTENVENTLVKAWVEAEVAPDSSVALRTVFAATTGVYRMLEVSTRTRMSGVFELHDVLGQSANTDKVLEFTVKYLEQVRAYSKNACPSCEHRKICHGAFGQHQEVGFFPLSKTLVEASADRIRGDGDGRIPPRGFIQDVIEVGLIEAGEAIPLGKHPSSGFPGRSHNNHMALVEQVMGTGQEAGIRDAAERMRGAKALLSYGGLDNNETASLPANLSAVLELDWLAEGRVEDAGGGGLRPGGGITPPPPAEVPAKNPIEEAVAIWVSDPAGELDGVTNDALRSAANRVLLQGLQADVNWIPPEFLAGDLWGPTSFDFEGSGRQRSQNWFRFQLPLNTEDDLSQLERRKVMRHILRWEGALAAVRPKVPSLGFPKELQIALAESFNVAIEIAALQDSVQEDLLRRVGGFLGGREGLAALRLAEALVAADVTYPEGSSWGHLLDWAKMGVEASGVNAASLGASLQAISARKGTGRPITVDLAAWIETWNEVKKGLPHVSKAALPKTAGKGFIANVRAARDDLEGFSANLQERMSGFRDKRRRCLEQVERYLGQDFTSEDGEALREVARAYCDAFQDLKGARSRLFEIVDQLPDLGDCAQHMAEISRDDAEWPELLVDAQFRNVVLRVESLIGVLAEMETEARGVLGLGNESAIGESEAITGLRDQLLLDLQDICGPEGEQ